MNARLMATCTICSLALAAFALSPQISAQSSSSGAGRGIFSSLKVGQMVGIKVDAWGRVELHTYEDLSAKAFMRHKVREIANDFVEFEFDDKEGGGTVSETRIPVSNVALVSHHGPSKSNAPGATSDDTLSDQPVTKPSTKPSTKAGTKKKT